MKYTLFFLLTTVLLLKQSKSDLPVHCLNHQISGDWKFELTKPKIYINAIENTCGHDVPDDESTSFEALQKSFQKYKILEVFLNEKGLVIIKNPETLAQLWKNSFLVNKKRNKGIVFIENYEENTSNGNWTMIYDEGFEVTLSRLKFFVFSSYFKDEDSDKFKSNCSSSLVGWYNIPGTEVFGCIRGYKINEKENIINEPIDPLVIVENSIEKKRKKNRFFRFKATKVEVKKKLEVNKKLEMYKKLHLEAREKLHLEAREKLHLSAEFREHKKVIDRLNKLNKSWVAGTNDYVERFSIKDLNKMAGRRKNIFETYPKNLQNKSIEYLYEDVTDLPKEFSWKDNLPKMRAQEDCGSCYAIASLAMISSRLQIHFKIKTELSIQHVIDCSYYNQGCDGGYPSLVGKFGNEVHLIEESCYAYKAKSGNCLDVCDVSLEEKVYKIKEYGYVGGRYGNTSMRKIMEEVLKNGPVVASFEPDYTFMFYKSGVYQKVDPAEWILKGEVRPEWQKIDHSVLLYGWGEENNEKYWLLQNSWGYSWGDNGSFKMRRGTDEMGIESSVEFAIPNVIYLRDNAEEKKRAEYYKY